MMMMMKKMKEDEGGKGKGRSQEEGQDRKGQEEKGHEGREHRGLGGFEGGEDVKVGARAKGGEVGVEVVTVELTEVDDTAELGIVVHRRPVRCLSRRLSR